MKKWNTDDTDPECSGTRIYADFLRGSFVSLRLSGEKKIDITNN